MEFKGADEVLHLLECGSGHSMRIPVGQHVSNQQLVLSKKSARRWKRFVDEGIDFLHQEVGANNVPSIKACTDQGHHRFSDVVTVLWARQQEPEDP